MAKAKTAVGRHRKHVHPLEIADTAWHTPAFGHCGCHNDKAVNRIGARMDETQHSMQGFSCIIDQHK